MIFVTELFTKQVVFYCFTGVGDLAKAIRARTDLHFGVYHSLYEWFNPIFIQDEHSAFRTRHFVEVMLRCFLLCGIFALSNLLHSYVCLVVTGIGSIHAYVQQKTMPELYELVFNYKPDIIWSDGDYGLSPEWWNATQFIAWLYNDRFVIDIDKCKYRKH